MLCDNAIGIRPIHREQRRHQDCPQPHNRAVHHRVHRRVTECALVGKTADHHDAIEHRLAEQRDEADRRRHAQVNAGQIKRHDAADRRERDVGEHNPGVPDGAERLEQQDEDEEHADRDDEPQSGHRTLLVLEFAAKRGVIAGREPDVARHVPAHLVDDAAHVAAPDEHADRRHPRTGFAADIHTAAPDGYVGDVGQRHSWTRRRVDQDVADRGHVPPILLAQPHCHAIATVAVPDLGPDLASKRRLDDVLDIRDVEPVAGRTAAVDFNLQLRHLAGAIDERARHAADVRDRSQHVIDRGPQSRRVVAEDLDHDLAVDLRDALEHVVANGLRNRRLQTRYLV
jgi:hypothetical protein